MLCKIYINTHIDYLERNLAIKTLQGRKTNNLRKLKTLYLCAKNAKYCKLKFLVLPLFNSHLRQLLALAQGCCLSFSGDDSHLLTQRM